MTTTVRTIWVATALGVLLSSWSPPSLLAQAPRVGVITTLEGNVTARRVGLPSPVPLKRDDDVFLQDTIITGDGARIEMVLGGKIDVAMQERSRVTITEVPGRSTLDLHTGQLALSVRGDRMRTGEEFHVRTPNAVAAVRGRVRMSVETLPATQAGGAAVTDVDVLDGIIQVVTYAGTLPATYAGTPRPAIGLRANEGLTITGDVAGPIRALRTLSPTTK